MTMDREITVIEYLIEKLTERNVRHIFGVPGDYALGLFSALEASPLQVVNTAGEEGAGFAADAYARVNGLGAVAVTYCVGGLKLANATAQAFAEKSPVVVICGAPGISERTSHRLLHHKVKNYDTQLRVFEEITADAVLLDNPARAQTDIDRVFDAAWRYKRPVYIELPRDMAMARIAVAPAPATPARLQEADPNIAKEFLAEATGLLNQSRQPVVVAGVEVHRFGLQGELLRFLEKTGLPVVTTPMSKSVLVETHPQHLGLYDGAMGREAVRHYVETSDCMLFLGVFMSDLNLGGYTAEVDQGKVVSISSESVSIHYHNFEGLEFGTIFRALSEAAIPMRSDLARRAPTARIDEAAPTDAPVTADCLFGQLNRFLDETRAVIADPGDALFGALDMTIHGQTEFLAPAYYASLGFAVPASLGVQLANPAVRPLVLVGDGAFQMSAMELAPIARYGSNPIIVVLNNSGYGTERPMLDGPFNDVHGLAYSLFPEVMKAGKGFEVHNERDLEAALRQAAEYTAGFVLIEVHLRPDDMSSALQRLTQALKRNV